MGAGGSRLRLRDLEASSAKPSDARKLKALEDENRKLKKLLAESMLDVATLREALGKNFWRPDPGGRS
jgi:hypothetical protein